MHSFTAIFHSSTHKMSFMHLLFWFVRTEKRSCACRIFSNSFFFHYFPSWCASNRLEECRPNIVSLILFKQSFSCSSCFFHILRAWQWPRYIFQVHFYCQSKNVQTHSDNRFVVFLFIELFLFLWHFSTLLCPCDVAQHIRIRIQCTTIHTFHQHHPSIYPTIQPNNHYIHNDLVCVRNAKKMYGIFREI